jgi:hypothetical protein
MLSSTGSHIILVSLARNNFKVLQFQKVADGGCTTGSGSYRCWFLRRSTIVSTLMKEI